METPRTWLRSAVHAVLPVLEVLFPNRCVGCDLELAFPRTPLCGTCAATCVPIHTIGCLRCGAEPALPRLANRRPGSRADRPRRCRRCASRRFAFQRATAALRYGAVVRALVHALKFERRRETVAPLADPLVQAIRHNGLDRRADVVVPLPLHPQRKMSRGFDQAELLARYVARAIDRPLAVHAIRRRSLRTPQSKTATAERGQNVVRAFAPSLWPNWLPGTSVRGQRVLLIDDVMTTGASLDAAARALLEAGARRVDAAVAAT